MKNLENKKRDLTDLYLDMVFPMCMIYGCVLFAYNIINRGLKTSDFLDVILLTFLAFGFVYGVLAIMKDLYEYGKFDTIIFWYRRIFKNK